MMRRMLGGMILLALIGCGGGEGGEGGAEAGEPAPPGEEMGRVPAAAAVALSEVAGTWTMRDSTGAEFQMMASADPLAWMLHVPDREPMRMRDVVVVGDTVYGTAGPFESIRRAGVMVNAQLAFVLRDGQLFGRTVAYYLGGGPDSVVTIPVQGTRAGR